MLFSGIRFENSAETFRQTSDIRSMQVMSAVSAYDLETMVEGCSDDKANNNFRDLLKQEHYWFGLQYAY
jgi:hypothetical protein